jgi:hypothetical protein
MYAFSILCVCCKKLIDIIEVFLSVTIRTIFNRFLLNFYHDVVLLLKFLFIAYDITAIRLVITTNRISK